MQLLVFILVERSLLCNEELILSFEGEAGGAGAATRGLYRVHQFSKVEIFIFCHPEESDLYHEELIAAEDLFNSLGLCPFSSDSSAPTSRKGKGANLAPTRFVYTLNATACVVPRMIVCLLENFQQEDGFIVIPEPLRPFMGGLLVISPNVNG
ncbi:serine--tRNA ligase, chloroplastic/mitochondrial isoform X2 [Canna indica]|uniref:Serine--tRNA ligase, chloroplastic/mitochondrial isoform X2 n=1 Tax=Canna indica TaxID=4628 RepID=A0AAQ3KAM7_9LILI|nr:serine--tRNA ligase, chloroplastic/mitochondrial isoform X2 [Canna indica]